MHPPARRWRRRGTLAALLLVSATAQAQVVADAGADLSFEQLTTAEVQGVSKMVERTLDAPASVTVVTGDEIRTYGFRTLAQVLNTAPGFYSYEDPVYGYVGVNGFAPIGSTNERLLLLIDGFPANDNFWEQALLGNEGIVDLDLIERVEIIRGPGSSIYGADAYFGVINVVLKNPSQVNSRGEILVGSDATKGASATVSSVGGPDVHYFLRATAAGSHGEDIQIPSQPSLPGGLRMSNVDAGNIARAFAKVVAGNLRINLSFNERRQQAGFGLHGDYLGDQRSFVRDGMSFADVHYEGSVDALTSYVLRASAAQYKYDAEIVDDPSAPGFLPGGGTWFDTEGTVTHQLSAHARVVLGGELRRDAKRWLDQTNALQQSLPSIHASENRLGAYAQFDADWSDQLRASLGLRDDKNDSRNAINPRLALVWKPDPAQSVKLMAGSAFREPSAFERYFAQPPSLIMNASLRPERIRTVDLEYDGQFGANTRLTLTAFSYRALDLIQQVVVDPVAGSNQFQNQANATARGLDASLAQRFLQNYQARVGLSYAHASDDVYGWLQNSPHWAGRVGVDGPVTGALRFGTELLFLSQRLAFDNSPMPGYTTLNVNFSTPPRRGAIDWTLGFYNLLDRRYYEPITGPSILATGRTVRATGAYSF